MYTRVPCSILGRTLRHPVAQALRVQLGMPGQRRADGVDDIVQEIGLISRMAVGARNHPIGAAGSHHIHPGRSQVGKQTPAGATVSRRLAVQLRLVNRLMVAGFNGPKEPQAATGQLIRPVLGGNHLRRKDRNGRCFRHLLPRKLRFYR